MNNPNRDLNINVNAEGFIPPPPHKRNKARKTTSAAKVDVTAKGVAAVNVMNKGYSESAASYNKKSMKGMTPNSGSPTEDIDFNNYTMRQRSRMLYMGAPIATSAIKTNRTNVVGNGLKLKSTINRQVLGMTQEQADTWQRKTEAEFELWASKKNACDATGINDFYGIQQLCLVSWLMSGDVFAIVKHVERTPLKPYGLRLHVIEADRVRTPTDTAVLTTNYTTGKAKNGNTIYDGVEVDSNGAIVAYHIANTYPNQFTKEVTEFTRVKAYGDETELPNILHIMDTERPEQYRGVPYLAPVIEAVLQIRRYTEAEIMSAIVQSMLTVFIKTTTDPSQMPFNEAIGADDTELSSDPNEYELGTGTINVLNPNEDISSIQPTHPNNGFDVFVRAIAEQVGAALEIPADLLLKAFNSSYSASRAALLEAWKSFRMRRLWLTNDLCKPVYEIWLTEAVALGRIEANGFFTDPLIRQAYLQSEWIGPSQGMLDPTKEISAAVMAIEYGLSTHEQEAIKLNGSEFTANIDKLTIENERLRAANGETGTTGQTPPNQNIQNSIRSIISDTVAREVKRIVETRD